MINYVLKYSYKNKKPITLIYQKQLEVSQRRIKVIQLGDKMVQAYCYEKKAIRNFKTDHILAAFIPGLINTTYREGDCDRLV